MNEPLVPLCPSREISAHPQEFKRGLALAFPGQVVDQDTVLRASDGSAALEIQLTVGTPRAIANLRLPTLYVKIFGTAGTPEQQQTMLKHMDRAMHRGGG
jgi:hypothetical protein